MILDSIADYLQAKGCGTVGKTIFEYEMPAECKHGVLLMNGYYGTPIDHEMRGWARDEVRVVVRGPSLAVADALARKCSAALTIDDDFAGVAGYVIKKGWAETEPRVYRRSAGDYWELEVDMQLRYVPA